MENKERKTYFFCNCVTNFINFKETQNFKSRDNITILIILESKFRSP